MRNIWKKLLLHKEQNIGIQLTCKLSHQQFGIKISDGKIRSLKKKYITCFILPGIRNCYWIISGIVFCSVKKYSFVKNYLELRNMAATASQITAFVRRKRKVHHCVGPKRKKKLEELKKRGEEFAKNIS